MLSIGRERKEEMLREEKAMQDPKGVLDEWGKGNRE